MAAALRASVVRRIGVRDVTGVLTLLVAEAILLGIAGLLLLVRHLARLT